MHPIKVKPENISDYILAAPLPAQAGLQEMLACLRKAAPGAEEGLKWGRPALSYQWILFQFAAFKDHISLFPTPSVVEALKPELSEFITSSSTIQFPLDKPLPVALIQRVAAYRVMESKEKGVKWM